MQQQKISPAIAAAAIVVLVLILAGIGWKVMAGGKEGSSGAVPEEAKKWLRPGPPPNGVSPTGGPPTGYGSGGGR